MGTPEEEAQTHPPPRRPSLQDVTNGAAQPATPNPSTDTGTKPSDPLPSADDEAALPDEPIDIFTLKPIAALELLCRSVTALVQTTDDVPPTPPTNRSRSCSPSPLTTQAEKESTTTQHPADRPARPSSSPPRQPAPDSLPSRPATTDPHTIILPTTTTPAPHLTQPAAILRKFTSKHPPPIPLHAYLLRLHQYCPMSTAVYLATNQYLHRLAVIEHVVGLTARNVHRLVLAGLRVAMKVFEDLSWPHRRFAKVGGVGERELGRLEVGFCFLMGWRLGIGGGELGDWVGEV